MKRTIITLVLAIGTLLPSLAQQQPQQQQQLQLTVMSKKIAPVSELFWGTNALYWIEDDESLEDGRIAQKLKNIPCKLLRYPGGTVADNFDWRNAVLFNENMFPYESGSEETDFEEFMEFCGDVGAEPILVVNTQTWALAGDIETGAAEAAAWVQYCKDNGHKVRFWEIGNETYWHPVMTALEYGELVNVYAKAMRAVDPEIILSVNGHWEVAFTGTKERIDPTEAQKLMEGLRDADSRQAYTTVKDRTKELMSKEYDPDHTWWADLLSVCGDNVDMLSVHWYFHANKLKDMDKNLRELKAHVKALKPEKDYMWCMSEFNCNEGDDKTRVTGFAEAVCRFLYAGYELGCFWPMRIGGYENRCMLSRNELNASYVYKLYAILAKQLKGDMVGRVTKGNYYAAVAQNEDQTTILVSTRNLSKVNELKLNLDNIPLKKSSKVNINTYSVSVWKSKLVTLTEPKKIEYTQDEKAIRFNVAPKTITIITIKH